MIDIQQLRTKAALDVALATLEDQTGSCRLVSLPRRSPTRRQRFSLATILDATVAKRGTPEFVRCDNGPEFTAAAIRDWCRFSGTRAAFIEPGSPWQNPYVESFNSRARDELFAREVFTSVTEARALYRDWCDQYNRHHPHSALGWLAPAAFAASCRVNPAETAP